MDGGGFQNFEVVLTKPISYIITDYNGENIQGSFYEQELPRNIYSG